MCTLPSVDAVVPRVVGKGTPWWFLHGQQTLTSNLVMDYTATYAKLQVARCKTSVRVSCKLHSGSLSFALFLPSATGAELLLNPSRRHFLQQNESVPAVNER